VTSKNRNTILAVGALSVFFLFWLLWHHTGIYSLILRRVTPQEPEIFGTYIAKYPFGTNTFVLSQDHTFTQEAVLSGNNEVLRSSGTWAFDSKYITVDFIGGLALSNGYGKIGDHSRKPSILTYSVRKYLFSRRLYIGGDAYYKHEKNSRGS